MKIEGKFKKLVSAVILLDKKNNWFENDIINLTCNISHVGDNVKCRAGEGLVTNDECEEAASTSLCICNLALHTNSWNMIDHCKRS